jgi:hypothetical protein
MNLDEVEARWRRKSERAEAISGAALIAYCAVALVVGYALKWVVFKMLVRAALEGQ